MHIVLDQPPTDLAPEELDLWYRFATLHRRRQWWLRLWSKLMRSVGVPTS